MALSFAISMVAYNKVSLGVNHLMGSLSVLVEKDLICPVLRVDANNFI
jgi:hypothetical protein